MTGARRLVTPEATGMCFGTGLKYCMTDGVCRNFCLGTAPKITQYGFLLTVFVFLTV